MSTEKIKTIFLYKCFQEIIILSNCDISYVDITQNCFKKRHNSKLIIIIFKIYQILILGNFEDIPYILKHKSFYQSKFDMSFIFTKFKLN